MNDTPKPSIDSPVSTHFDIDERYLQGAGVIQGGVVAGMLGDAARALGGAGMHLETLDIAFHRPASVGAFVATAVMRRRGRSTMHVEAELRDVRGRLVATAAVTCSQRPAGDR